MESGAGLGLYLLGEVYYLDKFMYHINSYGQERSDLYGHLFQYRCWEQVWSGIMYGT